MKRIYLEYKKDLNETILKKRGGKLSALIEG